MTPRCFVDTNIVVYANDGAHRAKQQRAIEVIAGLMRRRACVVSTQVLQEYACTALGKLGQAPAAVLRQVALFERQEVVQNSPGTLRRAIELRAVHALSFWDALIVAAAEEADCDVLLSEDMGDGQTFGRVRVADPLQRDDWAGERAGR
jgi:predicted nucleic acid-binding protein